MESILFNQLTETDYGQDNDELLLQQNGITKRVKSKNFFDGAIANAMHEKYTAGKLLVADEDGNIAESAKTEADLDKAGSAVTYVEQELTDEQKAQARDNIGLNDANTFNGNKTFEGDVQIKGTLKSNKMSNYLTYGSGYSEINVLDDIYNKMGYATSSFNNVTHNGVGKLIIVWRLDDNYGGALVIDYNNNFKFYRRFSKVWSYKIVSMS